MTSKLMSSGSFAAALVPLLLALVGTSPAHAQPGPDPAAPQDPYDPDNDSDDDDATPYQAAPNPDEAAPYTDDADGDPPLAPPTQQPMTQPPAPPANPPPAVQANPVPRPAPTQPGASGQWVFTQQHGWLWMPYGEQYVYPNESYPMEYVYAPRYGWTWLAAPWVWGWGPRVYFSIGGPVHYGWYHRGFVGHRGIRGPGFRGGVRGGFGGGHVIRGGHSRGHGSGGHFGGRGGRRH